MKVPLSRKIAHDLDLLPEAGSTNAELVARALAGGLNDFTVVATTSQTAGRGRLDRAWVAPPGRTIAVSVLLAPGELPGERWGWMPLLAGLAMTRAVASLVPDRTVALKWPNDVLVDGLKVSGILAELLPGTGTGAGTGAVALVIGAGLNLTMTPDELPTPASSSLTLLGAAEEGIVDRALAAYLGALRGLYEDFRGVGFDPEGGLRDAVTAVCSTIGREVRVELPGAADLLGRAEGLDEAGRLIVSDRGRLVPVAAGDVTHLRYD